MNKNKSKQNASKKQSSRLAIKEVNTPKALKKLAGATATAMCICISFTEK
jgi:hypothetical protein